MPSSPLKGAPTLCPWRDPNFSLWGPPLSLGGPPTLCPREGSSSLCGASSSGEGSPLAPLPPAVGTPESAGAQESLEGWGRAGVGRDVGARGSSGGSSSEPLGQGQGQGQGLGQGQEEGQGLGQEQGQGQGRGDMTVEDLLQTSS